jgi:hypothetical protein
MCASFMKVYNFYKHCAKNQHQNRQNFAGADAGVEKMAG